MYSSSSRMGNRGLNYDGSHDVRCFQCGENLGKTFAQIGRALCELCRRVENGEELTEEAIRDYKISKAGKQDVSMLLVPNEPKATGLKAFSLRSLGGDILTALGIKKKEEPPQKSTVIAKGKRRPRLFEGVQLGSMVDLDGELRKKSEQG
jgi:hypothetical protein